MAAAKVKGLITRHQCPQDADTLYRRYTFYSLNWDRIYAYDGSRKDEVKEEKKKAKGRKAQEVRRSRKHSDNVVSNSSGPVEGNTCLLQSLARSLNYCSVEDMLQLDWNYPRERKEQSDFYKEMIEKFALHRLGYISVDYDNAFDKVIRMFSNWDRCSEGLARYKLEEYIRKAESQLSDMIKYLQGV